VALSQAGFNRRTRFATVTLIIGANLPDIDFVSWLDGSTSFLKYHRGITHSILGVTVLAGILALVVSYLGRGAPRKKTGPPLDGRWLLATSWVATASHLLLDFTNSYGVRPFLPFSGRWYAWDIMFIFDPLLLALLTAGLGFPSILRLVSEEVGASKQKSRAGAVFCLCSLVLLWGVRDLAHRRALGALDSHTYHEENPRSLGAFPSPANPFEWIGVVETESAFFVLPAIVLNGDVVPDQARVFHKPSSSPALDAAMKALTSRVYSDFARFPWAQVEEEDAGFKVTLQDLRFASLNSRRRGFVVEIELDKNLRVRSESFSFAARTSKFESR
jgi:inner membrane protein